MYISLVTQALSTATFLSASRASVQGGSGVALALFDSGIDHLRMPVLRMPVTYDYGEDEEEEGPGSRRHTVSAVVQRYFGQVITIEQGKVVFVALLPSIYQISDWLIDKENEVMRDEISGEHVQPYRAVLSSAFGNQDGARQDLLWKWSRITFKRREDERKQCEIRWGE